MTIYITRFNAKTLGKSFMNIKSLRFIDVTKILEEYESYKDDEFISYVISKSIKDMLLAALRIKRYNGVVYSNPNLTDEIVQNIRKIVPDEHDFIFIDKDENNMDEVGERNFEKILFFPTGSRKRILHCEPITNPLVNWLHDLN